MSIIMINEKFDIRYSRVKILRLNIFMRNKRVYTMLKKKMSYLKNLNTILNTNYYHTFLVLKVSVLLILISSAATLQAKESESVLSAKEIKDLAAQIETVEKSFLNIKIQSEAWVERKTSSDPCERWQRTPTYWSSTAWLDGHPNGKMRVDVNKQVLEWKDGAAPTAEESYSAGFDGQYGRIARHTFGHSGKILPLKKGELIAGAPTNLNIGQVNYFTGTDFSINFWSANKGYKLSQIFYLASDPNTAAASKTDELEFAREEFQGIECIKFGPRSQKGGHESYWLDPSRGFALLGYENTGILKDGSEKVKSRIRVNKLKEVAPGVWWPMEASVESGPSKSREYWERLVYRASDVVANDPNLGESIYTVPFPEGYSIDDKVTGKKYKVGEDPNTPKEQPKK
jgi:hypothetical protein